jgi:prophage maintenance system killer protein
MPLYWPESDASDAEGESPVDWPILLETRCVSIAYDDLRVVITIVELVAERRAAAYGFALVLGHCFPDGDKRLALAIMDVFLQLNGLELTAGEADAVLTLRSTALLHEQTGGDVTLRRVG